MKESDIHQLVECVPNFSEGRNKDIIDALGKSIQAQPGIKLLGVEPDADYNRTVITFIGTPKAVIQAAFEVTKTAAQYIDMRNHKGEHPRIGAVDVVPFIPIRGVTMDECVQLAHSYGERVGTELQIPIYLYEYAARITQRKNLSDIRKGEYEGLAEKLKDPFWKPDYGAPLFNERSGATVTGARKILIAYNVNIKAKNDRIAHEIALRIRESGRPKKDEYGKTVKNDQGETLREIGTLKAVKALGVFLERYNIAQVSMNLIDYQTTSLQQAFEEVQRQAQVLGVETLGSELVGLVPQDAMVQAGKHYSPNQVLSEPEYISVAIEKLGLSHLEPFDPKKKIIEYQI